MQLTVNGRSHKKSPLAEQKLREGRFFSKIATNSFFLKLDMNSNKNLTMPRYVDRCTANALCEVKKSKNKNTDIQKIKLFEVRYYDTIR